MEPNENKCSKCNETFICNAVNYNSSSVECWCFDLPKIIPNDDRCLCMNCLKEMIKNEK
mgnify:CR=1 FL=1